MLLLCVSVKSILMPIAKSYQTSINYGEYTKEERTKVVIGLEKPNIHMENGAQNMK